MLRRLNCCSSRYEVVEPEVVEGSNIYYIEPKERLSPSALEESDSLSLLPPDSGKFDAARFILEWLSASTKDIKEETERLEKQIKAKNNESVTLLKQKMDLLKDIQTFIFGESENNYKSVAIRLEFIAEKTASDLKKIAKTPPLEQHYCGR